MKSLAEALPAELAQRIHPEWRQNEADYWACREKLLGQYRGQWIGFGNGAVIVAGTTPVEVFHGAHELARHPFVTCVGREHEPCRMRRAVFAYDTSYSGEPLPVVRVEFRREAKAPGLVMEEVIADTGADASALPWSDCERLGLDPAEGAPGLLGGVGESVAATIVFRAWVVLNGSTLPCRLQAEFAGQERILGRDVLNRLDVLFRGPAREVVVNP